MSHFGDHCRFDGNSDVYLRPRTLDEAVDALGNHRAQVLAGGTDFYPSLGERWPSSPIVDITAVGELKGISFGQDGFRIGGLTTWSEVLAAQLPSCFDALKSAAREIGGVQIQNRGTVAGNLCNASPAADSVPPLLSLDAEVELVSRAGRRRLSLADFIVGNRKTLRRADEILTSVIVPRMAENARSVFLKLGARRYLVISIVMVAVVLAIDEQRIRDVRIAVGSCSTRAQRLKELERSLTGVVAQAGLGALVSPQHVGTLSPIDDVRATAAYRREAALTMVRRALETCVGSF
jgi:CO/xanthine dehydrogenase FAD-binding subunit